MSASKADTAKTVRVKQIKSGIGFSKRQKATLKALGLSRIGREITHPDNPQVRGMIQKVIHLVAVEEEVSPKSLKG